MYITGGLFLPHLTLYITATESCVIHFWSLQLMTEYSSDASVPAAKHDLITRQNHDSISKKIRIMRWN